MLKLENITKQTELAKTYFQNKVAFTMGPVELNESIKKNENIQIIDVRSRESYDKGHIPGAISIQGSEIKSNLYKLSKDKITILYCYSQQCHLAAKTAIVLAENGYPVVELEGGFTEWKNNDMLIEV